MNIEKLFKEFVEKEWHDGHEPQGGYDHYDEDEELDENKIVVGGKELDREWTGWWWDKKDKWTVVDGKNNMLWTAKSSGEVEKRAEELRGFAKAGNSSKFSLSVTNPGYVTNHGRWGMPELDGDKMWKSIKSKPDQITIRKIDKKDHDRWFKREKLINKEYDYNDLELSFSGGRKHYAPVEKEEVEVEEARTFIDRKYEKKKKGLVPQSQKKKRWGSGGYGKGEEVEEDLKLIAVSEDICDVSRGDLNSAPMKTAWDKKCGSGKKKHTIVTKSLRSVYDKAEFDPFIEEALGEGYKDLPPHLQKLVKKIEKKQKDWNKQNPNAKIKTLVYNPETGKPDIEVKENTMKLEDTVKQVLEGKKKKGEDPLTSKEPMKAYEDSDKDEPGTQGDMKKYQAARAKVLKKFGVKSCSELEGDEKKACYSALDAAHVSDDEEEKGEKKEEKIHSKFFTAIKSLMKNK